MANNWFIEESLPDGTYRVVQRDLTELQALVALENSTTKNRLEMWSSTLAASPGGFAPAAYRDGGKIMVGNLLRMLMGMDKEE